MLSVTYNPFVPSVVMLSVVLRSAIMLSAIMRSAIMLSAIMRSVVMLNVMTPLIFASKTATVSLVSSALIANKLSRKTFPETNALAYSARRQFYNTGRCYIGTGLGIEPRIFVFVSLASPLR
jgi:hypothetical protein